MTAALLAVLAAAILVRAGLGFGGGDDDGRLRVYAASSLRTVFPAIDADARYSFGGSNQLQLQVERGAPADVFASASPDEAMALHRAGRCDTPIPFATNRLALVVPPSSRGVDSVHDLRRGGRRIAVGAPGVPIGDYTRAALARVGLEEVLRRNRVSREPNVASIVAKVALGSADAGFVYLTDARGERVRAIGLPPAAGQPMRYAICAVRDGAEARAFISAVRSARGRRLLAVNGFGLP